MDFAGEAEPQQQRGRRVQRVAVGGVRMQEYVDRIPTLERKVTMLETQVRDLSMRLDDSLASRTRMEEQIKDLQDVVAVGGVQMPEEVDRIPALESKVTMLETQVRDLSMRLDDSLASRMRMEEQIMDLQDVMAKSKGSHEQSAQANRNNQARKLAEAGRCLICEQTGHKTVNCPNREDGRRNKMDTMNEQNRGTEEEQGQQEIPTKLKSQGTDPLKEDEDEDEARRTFDFVEVILAGKKVFAMLNPSSSHNFVSEELARELKLKVNLDPWAYRGYLSPAVIKSKGRADKVPATIGDWRGALDLVVLTMNFKNLDLMFGGDFFQKTNSVVYFRNFLLIEEGSKDIVVKMIPRPVGEPGTAFSVTLIAIPKEEAKHESAVRQKAPSK